VIGPDYDLVKDVLDVSRIENYWVRKNDTNSQDLKRRADRITRRVNRQKEQNSQARSQSSEGESSSNAKTMKTDQQKMLQAFDAELQGNLPKTIGLLEVLRESPYLPIQAHATLLMSFYEPAMEAANRLEVEGLGLFDNMMEDEDRKKWLLVRDELLGRLVEKAAQLGWSRP
jgi:vancomycin resistance protein YoaR